MKPIGYPSPSYAVWRATLNFTRSPSVSSRKSEWERAHLALEPFERRRDLGEARRPRGERAPDPGDESLRVGEQRVRVDRRDAASLHDDRSLDDHRVHGTAELGVHDLVGDLLLRCETQL